jgi:integrase
MEEPKSRNGKRTLPLDEALADALSCLRKRQMDESAAAGPAVQAGLSGLGWYEGGEYLITGELGVPVHPEWYSDEFGRLRRTGLPRITLHDSRHTTLTLMEHAGAPISIISRWAGHYDTAFTQRTYVHARPEDLRRGTAALARIHKIA